MKNNQEDTSLNEDKTTESTETQADTPASPTREPVGNSGVAIAGMVLGIVGVVTSFLPIINNLSLILGIVGLILAIVGIVGINKGKKKGRGMAVAGIVLNIITIVIVLATQALYSAALDSVSDSLKAESSSTSQESSSSNQEASSDKATESNSAYGVSIDGSRVVTSRGNRVIVVTYTFTNNSDKDAQFYTSISDKAYQNGVELESTFDSSLWNSGNDQLKTIKTGSSITIEQGFKLVDSSPVTVEVKELLDFKGTVLVEATFDVA